MRRSDRAAAVQARSAPRLRCLAATAAIIAPLLCAGAAVGAPVVRLHAKLTPERLGAPSAVTIGFHVFTPLGEIASPVTEVQLLLPAGLSIATSELGLQTCKRAALEDRGRSGCPQNATIGRGSATAIVPFGGQVVYERVAITLMSAPVEHGRPSILVLATGEHPVIATIVFPGLVLSAPAPFGGLIETLMPPVPGLPNGPDVAITQMRTTIGPLGIVYSERVRGRLVHFHPKGIVLPRNCPDGGFQFGAALGFASGATVEARTRVRCPARREQAHAAGNKRRHKHKQTRRR